jgi:hypothetical protein
MMERYESGQEPIAVSPAVYEGIDLIRRSGACNMFDVPCVLQMAEHFGQQATAIWIKARKKDYAKGLFAGFRPLDPFWTAKMSDMESMFDGWDRENGREHDDEQ